MPTTRARDLPTLCRDLAPEIARLPRQAAMLDGFLTRAGQECAGVDAIAAHLSGDPAIGAWILRQANSGYCNQQRRLHDLGEACVVLGLEPVSRLAYAACSEDLLQHDPAPYRGTPRGSWLHGLAVGCGAAHLAVGLGPSSPLAPEAARIAGLLHDVGKLLVAARWPRDAATPAGVDHEAAVLGFDHAMASAAVAATWGLPREVINAIADHHAHAPTSGGALVAAANHLMTCWRVGTATYPCVDTEPPLERLAALLAVIRPRPELLSRWCQGCVPVVTGLDEMLRWSQRPSAPDLTGAAPPPPATPSSATAVQRRRSRRRHNERREHSGRGRRHRR